MTAKPGGKRDLSALREIKTLSSLANAAQEDKVLELTVDQVLVKPQVRRRFRGIEELAESLKSEGQQSPIIVSPKDPNTGLYELQKGGRRVKAAALIPGFKLKAIVDSTQRSASQAHASQLIENIQRDDLLPHELGRAILVIRQERQAEGLKATGRVLADLLKVKESYISKYLEIAEIPDDLAELVDDGVIADSEIIHSLKLISERSPVLYKELLVQARNEEDGGISRSMARETLKIAKGQITPIVDASASGQDEAGQGGNQASDGPAIQPQTPEPKSGNREAGTGTPAPQNIPPAETLNGKVLGAESGEGHENDPDQTSTQPAATPPRKEPAAKKPGKYDTIKISPTLLVIGVSVSFDTKVLNGELLTDSIIQGDQRKAWVRVLDGGKQVERLVAVDDITITSLAKLASGD